MTNSKEQQNMTPEENETETAAPAAAFADESIFCVDCGLEFIHTAAEKSFFAKMHYTNKPKRCVPCRRARKEGGASSPTGGEQNAAPDDEFYDIVCSACGKPDRVPFAPTPGRDVFCHACHLARVKGARGQGGDKGKPRGGKRDGCPARK
jgi:CxxC-x17-CxxC domain-containing protein